MTDPTSDYRDNRPAHEDVREHWQNGDWCGTCDGEWPCDAARLAAELAAVVQENTTLSVRVMECERAVAELRNGLFGFAQYLHLQHVHRDIWTCQQGICPGVRGLLRETEDAVGPTDTTIVVGAR